MASKPVSDLSVALRREVQELKNIIQIKEEKIYDLESELISYKEKYQNYRRLNEKKLKAYDTIMEM